MGKNSPIVYKYDLIEDEWRQIPIPCPHINPGLVFIDGLLTAIGGQTVPYTSDTKEVITWQGQWGRKFPSMQHAHSHPIVLVYKDWVIAMEENNIEETEVWKIHSFAWSSIKLRPPLDLESFTATVYDDNLILVNILGMSGCAIRCESLLNQSPEWRLLKSLSKGTTVTTFCGDAVCVNEDGILYKLKLDEGNSKWVEIENMTMASYTPVKAPIVCVVKNRLVVIGGIQGEFGTSTIQIGEY